MKVATQQIKKTINIQAKLNILRSTSNAKQGAVTLLSKVATSGLCLKTEPRRDSG
ncbi:UNVERIFIED_CONTAM: hypothetical protein FKN15_020256 [Acipenser sinensis]